MSETTKQIRIWPAIVIVVLQFAVTYGIVFTIPTNIPNVIAYGVSPLFGAIALLIWWTAFSGATKKDRIGGLIVFLAALAWIALTQKQFIAKAAGTAILPTRADLAAGGMMILSALPAINLGVAAIMVLTAMFPLTVRRIALTGFLVAVAGFCTLMRVETIGGDLRPDLAWRWTPSAAERSEALAKVEAHGRAALPAQVGPQDWPAFRGANRDNSAPGVKFSSDWSTPPKELWRRKIGPGMSSFAVVGDFAFTQEQRGDNETIACYDAKNGNEVWTNNTQARYEDAMGLGPRATPAYDSGKLYAQGAKGLLQCLDAATGKLIWKKDLSVDGGKSVPGYGFASSPLVAGNLVIAFGNGTGKKSVLAFDRNTGADAWTAGENMNGYSSPQLVTLDGVTQLLMFEDSGLFSFDPVSGKPIWNHAWEHKQFPRCVQPLLMDGGGILLGATSDTGSRLIRVHKTDNTWIAKEEWTVKDFRPYFNDCVAYKGYCYGFDGNQLDCVDAKNGKRVWQGRRCGGQVMILPDMDMLLVLEESGTVSLIKADPAAATEVAKFKAISGKTWNHPAIAHGKLFVRNSEEIACFQLPGFTGEKVAANR